MSGLTDTTGLSFGDGLQWQAPLGGPGLTITSQVYVDEDGVTPYVAEDGTTLYVAE